MEEFPRLARLAYPIRGEGGIVYVRMPIPPELEADCVVLDWPAGIELDAGALFEEVRAEIQASTNRPVRLDAASRAALLDRVRQMPAGRARFEIARALLAAGKHEP